MPPTSGTVVLFGAGGYRSGGLAKGGRDYIINGECLVQVMGRVGTFIQSGAELGLTDGDGKVRITPRWRHQDINIDDYGPDVPAEVLWKLADVRISMTLIHFNQVTLETCMNESMGGGVVSGGGGNMGLPFGTLAANGQPMGGGAALFASGNHYISLSLTSPQLGLPWTFPTAYLVTEPLEYPIGVERTAVQLTWRAIPYQFPVQFLSGDVVSGILQTDTTFIAEMLSSGQVLWNRNPGPVWSGY